MEELTKNDIDFILWCLGYIYSSSDKLDDKHKKYIQESHDRVLPKIAKIHEELHGRVDN